MPFASESPDQTLAWGRRLGAALKGDELILLYGQLGAGKTLLCKWLAEGLGVDPDEVVSPTFTLLNSYRGDVHTLHHLDLYRIGREPGALHDYPEIDDQLGDGVVVVEWPEYLADVYRNLPQTLCITFTLTGDESRLLTLGGPRAAEFTGL